MFRTRKPHAQNDCPSSFDFNPSAVEERLPVLCLAAIGVAIASYLALYQTGVITDVWDPMFGNGSREVLHSSLSRMFPIPDASLGALGYFADFATGAIGGARRWRTTPWLVLLYGAVVATVAASTLILAILQPLLVHAGCTLCLASAAISLVIAWLARHEVVASLRLVRHVS